MAKVEKVQFPAKKGDIVAVKVASDVLYKRFHWETAYVVRASRNGEVTDIVLGTENAEEYGWPMFDKTAKPSVSTKAKWHRFVRVLTIPKTHHWAAERIGGRKFKNEQQLKAALLSA